MTVGQMKTGSVLDEHMDRGGGAAGDLPVVGRQMFLIDRLRIQELAANQPRSPPSSPPSPTIAQAQKTVSAISPPASCNSCAGSEDARI